MSTLNTQFHDKIRKFPFVFDFMNYPKNFIGTKQQVQISQCQSGYPTSDTIVT